MIKKLIRNLIPLSWVELLFKKLKEIYDKEI